MKTIGLLGGMSWESTDKYRAEGVILGFTEICMLVKPHHTQVPLYNTTEIYAAAAVAEALA